MPHAPAVQTSFAVHTSPSSHGVPSAMGIVTQPCAGSQLAVAHCPGSGQTKGSLVQRFAVQRGFVWQRSVTAQSASTVQQPARPVCVQACRPSSHASTVHAFRSSQLTGVPSVHTPPRHVSAPSQKSPSSHDVPSARAVCVQCPPLHASVVQAFASSHWNAFVHATQPATATCVHRRCVSSHASAVQPSRVARTWDARP